MKIYSSFRDYYDPSFEGTDTSISYNRKEESVTDKDIENNYKFPYRSWVISRGKVRELVEFVYVFFCGQIYCGVLIENKWHFNDKAREKYQEPKTFFGSQNKFYQHINGNCHEINIRHDSPIIIYSDRNYGGGKIKKNCNLSFFNFMSAIDPFQANQRIAMFLGNDLARDIYVDNATNKDRILAAGFDLKESFRNLEPPKRKRK